MSMTAHGMNLKNPLAELPTEQMANHFRKIRQRREAAAAKKPKQAEPASKPKPSKQRRPYFYNPADRD